MPSSNLRHYIEHYLAPHPSHEVRELFLSSAILDFAVASMFIFEPIYLWQLGYTIPQILWYWVAVYVLYFVLLPLGGRLSLRHGASHTILFSSPFLIAYYLALFAVQYHVAFMAVSALALVICKILYWPGYHANFAAWGDGSEQGREVSNRQVIAGVATMFAPAFGGYVIMTYGFGMLFAIASLLILASNIPLLRMPKLYAPRPFSYRDALRRLFATKDLRRNLSSFAYGEELIALVLWPLFIALAIPNLITLGAVVSLSLFLNAAVALYVGRLTDEESRLSVLRSGIVFTAFSWLLRPFATGALGVFLMDAYYRVTKNAVSVPMAAMLYDRARKNDIMGEIVVFEQALSVGKILAALACILALTFLPGSWWPIFIIAAMFTGFFMLVRE